MSHKRKELLGNLIPTIEDVRNDKKLVAEIKQELFKNHNVLSGDTQKIFKSPNKELSSIDGRLLVLFTEQIYLKTGKLNLNPEDYFIPSELKLAKQYDAKVYQQNKFSLPHTIPDVMEVNGKYYAFLSVKVIKKMMDNLILNYNFETQREANYIKMKDGSRRIPKIDPQNIKEISNHLVERTFEETHLIWNASLGTADDGYEDIVYNRDKRELTINKGVIIDIIDGYHRCKAIQNALEVDPDIDYMFPIIIVNYKTSQAQEYLRQIAQATPMSKVRVEQFESTYANDVIKSLLLDSDLKGRISQTEHTHTTNKELTTYTTLKEVIEEEFKMETKSEAMEVADYLSDFFNYLIGAYKDEFIKNFDEVRKHSLMVDNNFFAGYVILAKRLKEEKIKITSLKRIIDNINFNRDNEEWEKHGILKDGKLTIKARDRVKDYFKNIDLKEVALS